MNFGLGPGPTTVTDAESDNEEVTVMLLEQLLAPIFELSPDMKPEIYSSRAELLQKFDKGVAEAREKISAATDEDWQKTWTLKYAGNVIFSMPRSAVMRSTVMNHLIHHRGQLAVYLRLNGVPVPGMYGPSADEPFVP